MFVKDYVITPIPRKKYQVSFSNIEVGNQKGEKLNCSSNCLFSAGASLERMLILYYVLMKKPIILQAFTKITY